MTIVGPEPIQRIARLTPLGDVLAIIDAGVSAVAPRACAAEAALGCTLAEDVVAAERPARPIALRDGWAVAASVLADAGPYAPVPLASLPPQVDVGDPLPAGTDAVAPLDAVTVRGDRAEVIAPVASGDGVLAAGADSIAGAVLRRKGDRVRSIDVAVFGAAGISAVTICEPRIRIACGSATRSPLIDAAIAALTRAVDGAGGKVRASAQISPPEQALNDESSDAVIVVGGSGSGRNDRSVRTLARLGRVEVHGIAIAPGETTAFGLIGRRPVLLVPGRIDAAMAAWVLLGRHLLARLCAAREQDHPAMLALTRKVSSNLGLTELVPVRRSGDGVEPLASGYLPLASLAHADGWIVIPPDSEGYAPGTPVAVRPWP
jgi:molybdopterin biosynthesis enzyme